MRYVIIASFALSLASCSMPDTSPALSPDGIEAAEVFVDGVPVGGGAVSGEMGHSLFQVRLEAPETVEHCAVQYHLPGNGLFDLSRSGEQPLYDDGTNGDDMPGDGVFHLLDADDAIGAGRAGSPTGAYQYHFHCRFHDDRESELSVTVHRQCGLSPLEGAGSSAPSC